MKRFVLLLTVILLPVCALAQGIQAGPWVTDVSETGLTILWTSELPGQAYVQLEDGRTLYDVFAGRRIFRRLHSVTVDGLKAGQVLKYRLGGLNLKDDTNARDPKFEGSYIGPWNQVKTLDSKAAACRFSVFNDIHMKTDKYRRLARQVDSLNTDFLFLNGDIVTAGNYVLDTLVRYAVEPLGTLPQGLPLFFARGNHEGRGNATQLVADVFPHQTPAPFYYTFRQGPVAFIVFDAGETHDDRSMAYAGAAVFEDYLAEQISWAKTAMQESAFQSAPIKICILHVPMIDHQDKSDFLLQRWLNVHMVPMLNEAGIDLMIGADLHEFMMCEAGTMGNRFPILVNDDVRRLDVQCSTAKGIEVKMVNAKGKVEYERTFAPKVRRCTMKDAGSEREYYLYVPDSLGTHRSLVFMLHGYGGKADGYFPAMIDAARKYGFILCYPQGLKDPGKGKTGWNVGYPSQEGWKQDDIAFILHLQDKLIKEYGIKNSFFSGMSNGGEMCYIMAYKHPERFNAICSLAGLTMQWLYTDVKPVGPVPFMEVHGTADKTSSWYGDPENKGGWGKYVAVPMAVGRISSVNNCTHEVCDTLPLYTPESHTVVRHIYKGEGSEVRLYEVIGGKHSTGNKDLNVPEEMWSFFKQYIR